MVFLKSCFVFSPECLRNFFQIFLKSSRNYRQNISKMYENCFKNFFDYIILWQFLNFSKMFLKSIRSFFVLLASQKRRGKRRILTTPLTRPHRPTTAGGRQAVHLSVKYVECQNSTFRNHVKTITDTHYFYPIDFVFF